MDQQSLVRSFEERAARLGISIAQVCRRADVHPTTFSRWKRSLRRPQPSEAKSGRWEAISRALDEIESEAAEAQCGME